MKTTEEIIAAVRARLTNVSEEAVERSRSEYFAAFNDPNSAATTSLADLNAQIRDMRTERRVLTFLLEWIES